ncbi:MAG: tRNA (adenosine(37)-N6)-threonylcarbamoyltransferase complex transferase subunit TsaD [Candidatus Moranbacteria bacterium]|nr:tRNA (adenosine(37)-N6)-threonylcarbamoyltransferase complex transferase subunit TsaD [Candidatus Moranbacteria bacterium]
MIILGIETSCDETAVSVVRSEKNKIEVLSNAVSSQVELHAKWGGVVPNLAAREHLKNMLPVLEEALNDAGITKDDVDLISVTEGPGLIPALLVGTNFSKTLSYLWKKPLLGIHHIEGHIYANFANNTEIEFPVLALVVSGGHTQLVLMKDHLEYEVIGQTQDDAVGEAFDKVARILDLGYPGGPIISAQAQKFKESPDSQLSNHNSRITLPRPMLNSPDFNFSFSGLKTAVLYAVKELKEKNSKKEFENLIPEISHEFQQACIDVLIKKTMKAAKKHNPKTILIAGGVSANRELKLQLKDATEKELANTKFESPEFEYSLDNAAMIAIAGCFRWEKMNDSERQKCEKNWKNLQASSSLKMNKIH